MKMGSAFQGVLWLLSCVSSWVDIKDAMHMQCLCSRCGWSTISPEAANNLSTALPKKSIGVILTENQCDFFCGDRRLFFVSSAKTRCVIERQLCEFVACLSPGNRVGIKLIHAAVQSVQNLLHKPTYRPFPLKASPFFPIQFCSSHSCAAFGWLCVNFCSFVFLCRQNREA